MLTEIQGQMVRMLTDKIPDDQIVAVIHAVNTPEREQMMFHYLADCKEITQDGVMAEVKRISLTTEAE